MNAQGRFVIALIICSAMVTGCWDMTEPNKRALWTGTALDLLPDGRIEFSAQMLVPSATGTEGTSQVKQTLVKTGIGTNVFDAMQSVQEQLSRQTYIGQRVAVFFSEHIAKSGIQKFVDEFERNPTSNLRMQAFLIKGQDAKDFLGASAALEGYTTKVATQASQAADIDTNALALHTFVNTSLSDGQRPIMQVIEVKGPQESKDLSEILYGVREIGLFNHKDQLVGYLADDDADTAAWVTGVLRKTVLTMYMERGHGTVSLELVRVHRKIRSEVNGKTIKVYVSLSGTGVIRENNSTLNMFLPQDLNYVRDAFSERTRQKTMQVISNVQKEYGEDIFGFGENVHRHHPYVWKHLRDDWDNQFIKVSTIVDVNLNIQLFGNKGPSAMRPDSEINGTESVR